MKQTKTVENWEELIKLVENVNPYKNTLVLSGFINELVEDRYIIRKLVFSIKPVEILKE